MKQAADTPGIPILLRRRDTGGPPNSWTRVLLTGLALTALTLAAGNAGGAPVQVAATEISEAAVPWVRERAAEAGKVTWVYRDEGSGFNTGFPSGLFGHVASISLDTACLDDPDRPDGCATDPNRLDRQRGTVMRVTFGPQGAGQFAGVNIEEPENWGSARRGAGLDLRGATAVVFDVRSPTPGGIRVQFGVGEHTTPFTHVPFSRTYSTRTITFASLGLTQAELADVHVLFTAATNDVNAPAGGGTVLLDNIRFEPVPARLQNVLSFPTANQTFGALSRSTAASGRVPFPPDQVLRGITTIYESALAADVLIRRGTPQDLTAARRILDAFEYALTHDNQGDPLPPAPDGSTGLHNAYLDGNLVLINDQGPGRGQAGQVRLAGFSCGDSPTGFCLLLDGATGGNNAFVVLALLSGYRQFNEVRYLNAARTISRWIFLNLLDTTGTGYGGYYLGYPDEGIVPKTLLRSKSIENNADIFSAFTELAAVERGLGNAAQAGEWERRANIAGDFVMEMFDSGLGRFYAGTVPVGQPAGPGITPDGPRRGADVINTFDFLDADTFTVLALASAPRYRDRIDWRRPVRYSVDRFAVTVRASGQEFHGFNVVNPSTVGPAGIAWEFTGQMVVAMRWVDSLYGESAFNSLASFYSAELRRAQTVAPFADGRGVVASTVENGDLLPPLEQCLNTPFQCIAERAGLAATVWAIYADSNINIFTRTTPAPAGTDLAVTQVASANPVALGGKVTFTVTVTNHGPQAATGVTLTDTLPQGVVLDSAVPAFSRSGNVLTFSLGTLASGASATASITVTTTVEGVITNTASVSGAEVDPTPANNTATATVQVAPAPAADLSLVQTASANSVTVGSRVTFTLTVTNRGPQSATGVTLVNTLPESAAFNSAVPTFVRTGNVLTFSLGTLASGASATASITVTPTQAQGITNIASVSGAQEDPVPADNAASAMIEVLPALTPDLTPSITRAVRTQTTRRGRTTYALEVAVSVRNTGRRDVGASTAGVFLSADRVHDPSDPLLGDVSVPAIRVGASTNVTLRKTLSRAQYRAGRGRTVAVLVDRRNQVTEANEGNNLALSSRLR